MYYNEGKEYPNQDIPIVVAMQLMELLFLWGITASGIIYQIYLYHLIKKHAL